MYIIMNQMQSDNGEIVKITVDGNVYGTYSLTKNLEIEIKTEKSWIVVREHPDGECHIHSISDNVSILKHIQKKPPEK